MRGVNVKIGDYPPCTDAGNSEAGKKTLILKAVQKVGYCKEIKHRWLDLVDSIYRATISKP